MSDLRILASAALVLSNTIEGKKILCDAIPNAEERYNLISTNFSTRCTFNEIAGICFMHNSIDELIYCLSEPNSFIIIAFVRRMVTTTINIISAVAKAEQDLFVRRLAASPYLRYKNKLILAETWLAELDNVKNMLMLLFRESAVHYDSKYREKITAIITNTRYPKRLPVHTIEIGIKLKYGRDFEIIVTI